jgi:hypothetical protein
MHVDRIAASGLDIRNRLGPLCVVDVGGDE